MTKKKHLKKEYSAAEHTDTVIKKHKRFKIWQGTAVMLSVIVLLCAVYTMILPALTMGHQTYCGKEEHMHTDECYETQLVCTAKEPQGHTHTDDCYADVQTNVCGLEQSQEHAHDELCYLVDRELICTKSEEETVHEHTDECYAKVLICGMEEHTHDIRCYADKDADIETAQGWERSMSGIALSGIWADDLVEIAESQLGYKESESNYAADENGSIRGYTRYGEWYDDPYGMWNAMFIAFCLNYAQIPDEDMPYASDCGRWMEILSECGMLETETGYVPRKGDVVFFNEENDSEDVYAGIVKEVITDADGQPVKINMIVGGLTKTVEEKTIQFGNRISGYAPLPENKNLPEVIMANAADLLASTDLTELTDEELKTLLGQITAQDMQTYLESLGDDEYDELMDGLSEKAQEILAMFLAGAALLPSAQPLADPPIYYEIRTENGQQVMHMSSTPYDPANPQVYQHQVDTYVTAAPSPAEKVTISKIVIDTPITAPENCLAFFGAYTSVTEIENLNYLDTSNTTNFEQMFYFCSSLKSLDMSGMVVDKAENLALVCGQCSSLENVDISTWNTGNVKDMAGMFVSCGALTEINGIEDLDAGKVTDMSLMFNNCYSLESIDLSGYQTDSLTKTSLMFSGCSSLTQLDVSGLTTDKVTDMNSMFTGCSSLTELDVTHFDTGAVTKMLGMFYGCSLLTELDVTHFNTENVLDMAGMFANCYRLKQLDLSHFDTKKVQATGQMFQNCSSLTELDLRSFETGAVTKMNAMFSGCSGLKSLDVSSFDTGNVKDMNSMFSNCVGLEELDVSNFVTTNVTNMAYMFRAWSSGQKLKNLDLSNFDTSNVTNMRQMFQGCSALEQLDISGFVINENTDVVQLLDKDTSLMRIETPASVNENKVIELPRIMVNEDDTSQVYGRMPKSPEVTGSITIVPYDAALLLDASGSKIYFKKYLDGVLVSDPQRFAFGVFYEDGTDTGIRVSNDALGNIEIETKDLPAGRYYVQEIAGSDHILYDPVKYYFSIVEETVSTQIVYPSSEVVYLPIDEDYLDTSKYDLVANYSSVTAYIKGTNTPVKTMRAYCADSTKKITGGPVGTTPKSVYVNPTDAQINSARGVTYRGPNLGRVGDAIKCILFLRDDPHDEEGIQNELWALLNHGKEFDTSRLGEIPASFKWAIIQKPNADVQPLIVPLWSTEDREVYDTAEGDSITRRSVMLETTDIDFRNETDTETYEVTIRKVDENDDPVSGALLKVFDSNGNEVFSTADIIGTDEDTGIYQVTGLARGQYTLHEERAPAGYQVAEDIIFNVPDEEGVITMVDMGGPYSARILVSKTLDGEAPGDYRFTFILRDSDGNEIARKQNDADGNVVFPLQLEADTYTFTVEELNDGQEGITYDAQVKTVTIVVGGIPSTGITANETGRAEFANYHSYSLPETGGRGTTIYIIGGLLMMGGALLLMYKTYRAKREDER